MHPIRRYVEKVGITQAEFAGRADLSPQFITDVIRGRSQLGRNSALALVAASGGALTLEELFQWRPRGKRKRAA